MLKCIIFVQRIIYHHFYRMKQLGTSGIHLKRMYKYIIQSDQLYKEFNTNNKKLDTNDDLVIFIVNIERSKFIFRLLYRCLLASMLVLVFEYALFNYF